MRLAAIALFVSIAALNASGGLVAGETATGSIVDVVFDDYDGDGVQDEGEPGLQGQVIILKQDGAFLQYLSTGSDGRYVADGLESGEYTLNPEFNDYVGGCPRLVFSFSPLQRGYCGDFALPRSADPAGPVLVDVESGMNVEINFGTQQADVAVVTGVALLEDDVAPQGASIVAYVSGQECGSTISWGVGVILISLSKFLELANELAALCPAILSSFASKVFQRQTVMSGCRTPLLRSRCRPIT